MGLRSGAEPTSEQAFVRRLLNALDMTPSDMANEIAQGDPSLYRDALRTLRLWLNVQITELPDLDRDFVWDRIEAYVTQQLGYTMAAKDELNRLLSRQRAKRQSRLIEQRGLGAASAPSSLPRRPR